VALSLYLESLSCIRMLNVDFNFLTTTTVIFDFLNRIVKVLYLSIIISEAVIIHNEIISVASCFIGSSYLALSSH